MTDDAMTDKTPRGFATEAIARERAATDFPDRRIVIIESRRQYYVELEDDSPLIRSWEREVYTGLGRNATRQKTTRRTPGDVA